MHRETMTPRPNWQQRVESRGFTFHTGANGPYWDESACYVFSRKEIDTLEQATYALHEMCLKLVQHVIDEKLFALFLIPDGFAELVVRSWNDDEVSIYGRFDLAFSGNEPPKLLEYNADTPTALLEAAVIQWDWLQDIDQHGDQFNSIDERLVESAWPALKERDDSTVHFTTFQNFEEDAITIDYLRNTAIRAGLTTASIDLKQIGWDQRRGRFVDGSGNPIHRIFKLYPWEWLTRDQFGPNILQAPTSWTEPAWKMILSSKSILPLLWELFPDSPYLLPASFDPLPGDYVRKPVHAREGSNIQIVSGGKVIQETTGPYTDERAVVYQQLTKLMSFDGHHAVIGSWVVNGWACGIGVREDDTIITQNTSRFVPHRMDV